MANVAQQIIKQNGYEHIVTVIKVHICFSTVKTGPDFFGLQSRVEDLQLDEEVDIILSEWMGYCLFYEGMLRSVVSARDRWLKSGGLVLPAQANIYLALVDGEAMYKQEVASWRNVHGYDMSPLKPYASTAFFRSEIKVCSVKPQVVCYCSLRE